MAKTKQKHLYLPDGSVDTSHWIDKIKSTHHLDNTAILEKACFLTKQWGQGLTTFYGQPCIEQGLEIAEITLHLKLDQETAAAGMISSIASFAHLKDEMIEKELGKTVSQLVKGMQQLEIISMLQNQKAHNKLQIDKVRKMLLAMATDIRVVIIKLAERLCLLRGISDIPDEERKRYAQEIQDIHAPLANRLGIGQLKWELEDLSLRYLDPDTYAHIKKFLAETRLNREDKINRLISTLEAQLKEANIKSSVSGRAKHIYSIYSKAKKNNISYKDIYDYSAVRILVNTVEDCYSALSIVHHLWSPITKEFDDYISNPKPNGYRSIHTAVFDDDGKHLEIQIRTFDMHDEAERGVAAHWMYKERKAAAAADFSKINYLRKLIDWHKDIATSNADSPAMQTDPLDDQVYVLTPAGDILDLPKGATPVDFAYHVHTDIGHHCRGAKVNGRIAHLTSALHTGDKVEIITIPEGGPSRDWLNPEQGYIKSSRARTKIAHWFKQQVLNEEIAAGKRSKVEKPLTHVAVTQPTPKVTHKPPTAEILGGSYLLSRFAHCCKPIPGDDIIGYIAQGKGLSIHKRTCNNVKHLSNTRRFMEISWDNKNIGSFNTDIKIIANRQERLTENLMGLLATEKITLLSMQSNFSKNQHTVFIFATVQVEDIPQLQKLIHRIKQLPGVVDVNRMKK